MSNSTFITNFHDSSIGCYKKAIEIFSEQIGSNLLEIKDDAFALNDERITDYKSLHLRNADLRYTTDLTKFWDIYYDLCNIDVINADFLNEVMNTFGSYFDNKIILTYGHNFGCVEAITDSLRTIVRCDEYPNADFNSLKSIMNHEKLNKLFDTVISFGEIEKNMSESLDIIPKILDSKSLFVTTFNADKLDEFVALLKPQMCFEYYNIKMSNNTIYFYGITK